MDNLKPCEKWTRHDILKKGTIMKWTDVLGKLITGMSPEIREEMKQALDRMEAKAKTTKLPFDDLAVMLLRIATGV